jgi:hypothetical protein
VVPVITQNNNGSETVRFANLSNASIFAGADLGLLRLEVQLDANLDGTAEATAFSATQVWMRRTFSQRMTFSMPLLKPDLFRGRITSTNGTTLQSGAEAWTALLPNASKAYIEITSGDFEGHRFDVDTVATSGINLVVKETLPTRLINATFALRSHWIADELFPANLFTAGTSTDNADRLLFFDGTTNAFRTSWLAADGWTGDSDGTRIMAPGEGLMIHARSTDVTLTLTGGLRSNRFHQPLKVGTQLVGSGFPMDHSPLSLGLTTANGFTASTRATSADRLRLWEGDHTAGAASYRSLFYLQRGNGSFWVQENDASLVDQSRAVLIGPGQAFFILPKAALPDFREP